MSSSAVPEVAEVSYRDFVWKLCKPGEAILSSLTPSKSHLWHMTSAIMGETAELLECIRAFSHGSADDATTRENVIEELGDLWFFDTGIDKADEFCEPLGGEASSLMLERLFEFTDEHTYDAGIDAMDEIERVGNMVDIASELSVVAGLLFDTTKIYVLYVKQFDRETLELQRLMLRHLAGEMRKAWGVSMQEVETHNRKKLKERYNKLVYNDQHAQDRADKA